MSDHKIIAPRGSDNFNPKSAQELENILEYQFKNIDYLREALSHPSLKQIDLPTKHVDYERFELLGDSILNFIIVDLLFHKYKDLKEGDIAKIKSYLVSGELLNEISKKLQLSKFLIMTKGEENCGGRENPGNVENAMEALIAAIYLDSGDIAKTKNIVKKLWEEHIHEFDIREIDPKSSLQEWAQRNSFAIPRYEVINQSGPAHLPEFTVKVIVGNHSALGNGKSIRNAEKAAAKILLFQLDDN